MAHTLIVKYRKNGTIKKLKCPKCGGTDIAEVDKAVRWNQLEISREGVVYASTSGPADFEGDGYICQSCLCRLHPSDVDAAELAAATTYDG